MGIDYKDMGRQCCQGNIPSNLRNVEGTFTDGIDGYKVHNALVNSTTGLDKSETLGNTTASKSV